MLVKDQAALDARELLEQENGGIYPVDVRWIAQTLGIQVTELILPEDVSGMLQVEPGLKPCIYVDANDVAQRKRFTIAHEIGHFVERTTRGSAKDVDDFNFIDRRGGPYDLHEFYADEFAGNLLMPRGEIHRLQQGGAGVVGLARHFDVSIPAMRLRLGRIADEA